jgi:hypothetical protein
LENMARSLYDMLGDTRKGCKLLMKRESTFVQLYKRA